MFVVNVASCYFASSLEASVTIHCYDFAFTTAVGSGLSLYCWFAGGLRIIDINDPANPKERGYFISQTGGWRSGAADQRCLQGPPRLLWVTDKERGLDVIEYKY
jgi:hypothetical protein